MRPGLYRHHLIGFVGIFAHFPFFDPSSYEPRKRLGDSSHQPRDCGKLMSLGDTALPRLRFCICQRNHVPPSHVNFPPIKG
jgi:hypothetical protein